MRKIEKGVLPVLERWKLKNKGKRYADLVGHEAIKDAIRKACVTEQHGLCAYCCRRITDARGGSNSAHNEHVEAQRLAPGRTLDFQNMVASCNQAHQCGNAHAHQTLPLTPLMAECETELQFELSGLVKGNSDRAITSIRALNLGDTRQANRGLVAERKTMIDSLMFSCGIDPAELVLEDDGLLQLLLDDLSRRDDQQRLRPFSPVLANVIRRYQLLRRA
ncbi:TIGR02646 family protein [Pseudomonas viridiflava]|uniref:TIGR02646 family protein n=1 Tax=Pseudomonas viridiflava TaxID=33069 RepID=UPI000F060859|nr:TIGR02646 family protein [Pseudomonas viridiflava]